MQGSDQLSSAQVRAIEFLADVLATSEEEGRADDFYGRLSEATSRLTSLNRVVIFRYDSARRRVRAAGSFGVELDVFAGLFVTVESAPIARRALEEDQVLEVSQDLGRELPPEYEQFAPKRIVCAPMAARGRWIGVIIGDRDEAAPPLDDAERELLWILGKTAALASMARVATRQHEKALQLEQRIDLAREVHDRVIQRLFGVSLALSGDQPFDERTRDRCAEEVQNALADLRSAVSRPLGRSAARTKTTLGAEVQRLRHVHPELGIEPEDESGIAAPPHLEPLAQSVLTEAVRNAHKHARPSRVGVRAGTRDGAFVLEVTNNGVKGRARTTGMGLRLAGFEALQAGGLLEFGERGEDTWQVRLVVPCDEST
jgi:signal transduction histidine kinase